MLDFEFCYRALRAKDRRFDGVFFTGVTTTGIYCRPSCPALTPKRKNLRFFKSSAAAVAEGFRACKRCRPDAAPGSPEWNVRGDLAGRAMGLIADGVIDREGIEGLANRLGYSQRHVHRQLVAELGAGPLALARVHRASLARTLLETTTLRVADVAFASGFRSIRQFNDSIREVYAVTPTQLRHHLKPNGAAGSITITLSCRTPFNGEGLIEFLGDRALAGLEDANDAAYSRSLRLPKGQGVVELRAGKDAVSCRLHLSDLRDLGAAIQRCRRLLDLDADPATIDGALKADKALGHVVRKSSGLRVPGSTDGFETAVRALVGQRVSVKAARTITGRMVKRFGERLDNPCGPITHVFPSPEVIAELDSSSLPMPRDRASAIRALARAVRDGDIDLSGGGERTHVTSRLLEISGIGPWTASYISMRALGDPDAFLPTDLGVRHAAARLGWESSPRQLVQMSERWRPWRSYATQHLWRTLKAPKEKGELSESN